VTANHAETSTPVPRFAAQLSGTMQWQQDFLTAKERKEHRDNNLRCFSLHCIPSESLFSAKIFYRGFQDGTDESGN